MLLQPSTGVGMSPSGGRWLGQPRPMHPTLTHTATARNGVFTPDDARAAGYTTEEIRTQLSIGCWIALRRGVYTTRVRRDAVETDPYARHRLFTAAALAAMGRSAVASHTSAAVALGLQLLDPPPDEVHLTAARGTTHVGRALVVHRAQLPAADVTEAGGLPTTSVSRTVFDVARLLPFPAAVATADDALHRQLTAKAELQHLLMLPCASWPGRARASRVVRFADGRAESAGESLGRVAIAIAGLPAPTLQVPLYDDDGLIGYGDFGWVELGVVGEFDGRGKYRSPDDLYREKLREDRIRRLGVGVMRFGWAVARYRPTELVSLFAEARRQSRRPIPQP